MSSKPQTDQVPISRPAGGWTEQSLAEALHHPERLQVPSTVELLGRFASSGTISRLLNIDYRTVEQWARAKRVPLRYWHRLSAAAQDLGIRDAGVIDWLVADAQYRHHHPDRWESMDRTDPHRKTKQIPTGKPPGPRRKVEWGKEHP